MYSTPSISVIPPVSSVYLYNTPYTKMAAVKSPVCLVVIDGWGVSDATHGNDQDAIVSFCLKALYYP